MICGSDLIVEILFRISTLLATLGSFVRGDSTTNGNRILLPLVASMVENKAVYWARILLESVA